MCLTEGNISKAARVSVVKQNLKEAECKTLIRRTGSACEALLMDEVANITKVRCLYGNQQCICDGYKREGYMSYSGRSSLYLPEVRESAKGETFCGNTKGTEKKSAETIVNSPIRVEGSNLKKMERRSMTVKKITETEKRVATLKACSTEVVRKTAGVL